MRSVFLLVLLAIYGAAAGSSSLAEIDGRWIPEGLLGVVGVNASFWDGRQSACLIQLINHMPGNSDRWVVATGFVNLTTLTIEVEVLRDSGNDSYVLVSGVLSSPGSQFPQIQWNDNKGGDGVPAAFTKGMTWSKYGSGTVCRTNSPMTGARVDDMRRHHSTRGSTVAAMTPTAGRSRSAKAANITKVHVVFTQHFDLGYTDFAWCVVSHYFWYIYPGTALTALEMPSYVYTTHSWLLYFFYNCDELLVKVQPPPGITFVCPSAEVKGLVTQAILSRQIVWHAFPFDGFNEMLGETMMNFAFNFAEWLEDKFFPNASGASGRLHSMQQVDVPGLCRAQVQFLLNRNVTALYIGQNPCPTFAGVVPELPNLFMWEPLPQQPKTPSSEAVDNLLLVFTHKYGYGGLALSDAVIDEPSQTAFVVQCTLENHPPYTPQDVAAYLERVAAEFPSCDPKNVIPSTYDAFAADVKRVGWPRKDLLRYKHDIGDSWVRALASDPVKTKTFLKQRRAFEDAFEQVHEVAAIKFESKADLLNNVLFTMTGCEHNWGLPWQGDWQSAVYSYEEKRNMLQGNFSSTSSMPRRDAKRGTPKQHDIAVSETGDSGSAFQCDFALRGGLTNRALIRFDALTGAIVNLTVLVINTSNAVVIEVVPSVADEGHRLFELLYAVHETTGPSAEQATDGWGDPEPQLVSIASTPTLISISQQGGGCSFKLVSMIQQTYFDNNTKSYTQPTDARSMTMMITNTVTFSPRTQGMKGLTIDGVVGVAGKLPSDITSMYQSWNREFSYGDSFFVQFNPIGASGTWSIGALGTSYSPYDFGPYGTCNYHVADFANASLLDRTGSNRSFSVSAFDSPLLVFGWNNASWVTSFSKSSHLCEVNDETGVWYNLWNQWNANWVVGFPWREADADDLSFRFAVDVY